MASRWIPQPSKGAILYFATITIVSYAIPAFPTEIVERTYAQQSLRLPIPVGYCALDKQSSLGKPFYDLQEGGNKGLNKVGVLFVDCTELELRRANQAYRIKKFGSYLFQLIDGAERSGAITRKSYLDYVATSEKAGRGLSEKQGIVELQREVNVKLANTDIKTAFSINRLNLGLIFIDEIAAFYGMGASARYPTEEARILNVMVSTIVNDVPISINLYQDFNPAQREPFRALLEAQKRNAIALITANRSQ